MFSPTLLDHFEHPRNSGILPDATVRARVENPVCADTLELALRIENGSVEAVRFLAKGCVPSMACASVLTTLLEGRMLRDLASITAEQIEKGVGGLPEGSSHAAQLAVDALRQVMLAAAELSPKAS
jgi:nitrogen fixation protein NifU and related proteins